MRLIFFLAFFLSSCSQPGLPPLTSGLVLRVGVSNGPENDHKLGVIIGYRYESLKLGDFPVRKDRVMHPIVGGNARDGFITKGSANRLVDLRRITPKSYSGFVLAVPGLDPLSIQ